MCRLSVRLTSLARRNTARVAIESSPRSALAWPTSSARSDDSVKGRNRQQISQACNLDHCCKAEIGRDDRRRRGSDHGKAAVDPPCPNEHVIFAETSERRHRDRHWEAHQEGGRGDQKEANDEAGRIGERSDRVEHAAEIQSVQNQYDPNRDE